MTVVDDDGAVSRNDPTAAFGSTVETSCFASSWVWPQQRSDLTLRAHLGQDKKVLFELCDTFLQLAVNQYLDGIAGHLKPPATLEILIDGKLN